MVPAKRLQNILKDLQANGIHSVGELSEKYQVSDMTIRRDLKLLEDQGFITRTHGGAVPNITIPGELQFTQKQVIHEAEKSQIARYAVQYFIAENDIISMEGGTTVAGMVTHMATCRNVTVMTNGLHPLFELQRIAEGNTIICTGGILREVSNTLVGPVAEAHFNEFNASKVFLSATGWTAENGFTDPNMLEIQVKKAMVRSARQVIMLLDSSKFGTVSLTHFLDAFAIHDLITDKDIPDQMANQFSQKGVTVHIVE